MKHSWLSNFATILVVLGMLLGTPGIIKAETDPVLVAKEQFSGSNVTFTHQAVDGTFYTVTYNRPEGGALLNKCQTSAECFPILAPTDPFGRGQDINSVWTHPKNPNLILVGLWEGVNRSEDGGATWETIVLATPMATSYRIKSGVFNFFTDDPDSDKLYLVAAGDNPQWGGMFYSTDRGKTWTLDNGSCGGATRISWTAEYFDVYEGGMVPTSWGRDKVCQFGLKDGLFRWQERIGIGDPHQFFWFGKGSVVPAREFDPIAVYIEFHEETRETIVFRIDPYPELFNRMARATAPVEIDRLTFADEEPRDGIVTRGKVVSFGTNRNLWISHDRARTWQVKLKDVFVNHIEELSDGRLAVATRSGLEVITI